MAIITDKQKELFQLMNQGSAFKNPLQSGSSALTSSLGASAGHISTLTTNLTNPTYQQQLAAAGLSVSVLTNMTSSVASAGNTVSTLTSYGDKAVTEFSQRARIADNYRTISQNFTGVDPGCSALDSAMGVVKSIGQSAMDAYNAVMSTVNSAISALNTAIKNGVASITALAQQAVTAINSAISKATEFANKVVQMIEDEAEELARQAAASVHAWLAGVLPDWFNDDCKSGMMDVVGTPELKNAATTA